MNFEQDQKNGCVEMYTEDAKKILGFIFHRITSKENIEASYVKAIKILEDIMAPDRLPPELHALAKASFSVGFKEACGQFDAAFLETYFKIKLK